MAETYITERDAIISLTLAGVTWPSDIKSLKSFAGGDPEASQEQMIPGNLMNAIATPGPIKRSPVVIEVPYSVAVDAQRKAIESSINQTATASFVPKDAYGAINGETTTRTGLCRKAEFPKWDAESGKTGILTVTITPDT
jgi:hypothetical protein